MKMLHDIQFKKDYWDKHVEPAINAYLMAYKRLGTELLERNLIKPQRLTAIEWLMQKANQQSIWDGNRQIQKTGTQCLSQKNLWPTKDEGAGESLRLSMLKAIRALKKAPHINPTWLDELKKGDL